MGVGDLLKISGILVSVIAALVCLIVYLRAYASKADHLPLRIIGVLNVIISLSMALVVFSALFLPTANNSQVTSTITLAGIVTAGIIIVAQIAYLLLSPISPLYMRRNALQQVTLPEVEPDSDIDKLLRSKVIGDQWIKHLPILHMNYPLDITNMYIQVKVYERKPLISLDNTLAQLDPLDPLTLLDREYDAFERRVIFAQNPIEIIGRRKHCIILGEPGIGKTTLLKYLTMRVAKGDIIELCHLLPIYISLKGFKADPNNDLLEFILDKYFKNYALSKVIEIDGVREFLIEKLEGKDENRNVLLLLDGLDETFEGENDLSARSTYNAICKAISDFAGKYSEAHIIVTSRKASYEAGTALTVGSHSHVEFKKLEMAGFLSNDVKRFVTEWSRDDRLKQRSPDGLILMLQQESRLRELSASPLLLSFVTSSYFNGFSISDSRPELYNDWVKKLLFKWDDSQGVTRYTDFSVDLQRDLLKELAWNCYDRHIQYYTKEDILKFTEGFLRQRNEEGIRPNSSELLIEEILATSGLLIEEGEGLYSFSHITFQEYFAAMQAAEKEDEGIWRQGGELVKHWGELRWDEVILLAAAYASRTDTLLKKLTDLQTDDFFYTNLLLAGRCIAVTAANSLKADEVKQTLWDKLLTMTHQSEGDEIAKALVEIADKSINAKLLQLLPLYQRKSGEIAEKISEIAGEEAYKKLQERGVIQSKDEYDVIKLPDLARRLSIAVAKTLLRMGDPAAYVHLAVPKLMDNTHEELSDKASKYSSIASRLIGHLSRPWLENDMEILINIVKALKRLREPSIVSELCDLLNNPPPCNNEKVSKDVSMQIADTLGVLALFCQEQDNDQQVWEILADTLLKIVNDGTRPLEVRWASLDAFGLWRNKAITPKLRELVISKELDWRTRARITIVLEVLSEQGEEIEPDLLAILDENLPKLGRMEGRYPLLHLLDFLEGQNAYRLIPKLVKLLERNDLDRDVYRRIVQALGSLGDENITERLLSHLQDTRLDNYVRGEIVSALGKLYYNLGKGTKARIIQNIIDLINDVKTHHIILMSCAEALHQIDQAEMYKDKAIEELRKYRETNKYLHHIPSYINLTITLGRLEDSDPEVRADLLRWLFDPDAGMLLSDPPEDKWRQHLQIVEALQHIGKNDDSMVNVLCKQLFNETTNSDVQMGIIDVLKCIVTDPGTCVSLIQKMEQEQQPEIADRIYDAVHEISRRNGFRVYKDESGQIRVVKWEQSFSELVATSGS